MVAVIVDVEVNKEVVAAKVILVMVGSGGDKDTEMEWRSARYVGFHIPRR
jgi:hypothetical protein